MKATGIIRKLDELGRIVLPIELRRLMGLNEKEAVEVFVDDEARLIMLRKYQTMECLFCSSIDRLVYFRDHFICTACLEELGPGRSLGIWEAATAWTDDQAPAKSRYKLTDAISLLTEVMTAYPAESQTMRAARLDVTPARASQLLRYKSDRENAAKPGMSETLRIEKRKLIRKV